MSSEVQRRLAFVDTETTGLDSDTHEVWDIAVITRDVYGTGGYVDAYHQFFVLPDLSLAHPKALEIGKFWERMPQLALSGQVDEAWTVAGEVLRLLNGRHVIGMVPDFDSRFLWRFVAEFTELDLPPWHYHLIDVETLAVGWLLGMGEFLPPLPWRSDDLSRLLGVEPPESELRHTAMADAQWARELWDRIVGTHVQPTTLDEADEAVA